MMDSSYCFCSIFCRLRSEIDYIAYWMERFLPYWLADRSAATGKPGIPRTAPRAEPAAVVNRCAQQVFDQQQTVLERLAQSPPQ
jgi:hypothetical protein